MTGGGVMMFLVMESGPSEVVREGNHRISYESFVFSNNIKFLHLSVVQKITEF